MPVNPQTFDCICKQKHNAGVTIMQKIRKAYMFRLKTNRDIKSKLLQFCGSSRFLWNKSLAMNLERLEKRQSLLWYQELAWWLTLWKQYDEYSFLKECPSQVLQHFQTAE